MYFPYLRGKIYELALIEDCMEIIRRNHRIVPIVEPVRRECGNLAKKMIAYIEKGVPIVLITNPTVGELCNQPHKILDDVVPMLNRKGDSHILGFILTESTNSADIQRFMDQTRDNKVCFIHAYEYPNPRVFMGINNIAYHIFLSGMVDTLYQRHFTEPKNVIIEDGFKLKQKNALYPNDENFSSINLTYKEGGFVGFGDYLIVGKEYKESGGPAHAVVIHLTYTKENGGIGIRHFVSDRTDSNQDTPGKFGEALAKLIAERTNPRIIPTMAISNYQDLYDSDHFPGLGFVKKLSMEHHIELMASLI